jgi:hypothetical protein
MCVCEEKMDSEEDTRIVMISSLKIVTDKQPI